MVSSPFFSSVLPIFFIPFSLSFHLCISLWEIAIDLFWNSLISSSAVASLLTSPSMAFFISVVVCLIFSFPFDSFLVSISPLILPACPHILSTFPISALSKLIIVIFKFPFWILQHLCYISVWFWWLLHFFSDCFFPCFLAALKFLLKTEHNALSGNKPLVWCFMLISLGVGLCLNVCYSCRNRGFKSVYGPCSCLSFCL